MPPGKLLVWVQPRASRTQVVGRHGEAIKIKLAAPPVDGAANEELIRFIAESLGVPRSAVTLIAGHKTRRKTISVMGMTSEDVTSKLLS